MTIAATFCPKPVLPLVKCLAVFKVPHQWDVNDVLEGLTEHTREDDWAIIHGVVFVTFLQFLKIGLTLACLQSNGITAA